MNNAQVTPLDQRTARAFDLTAKDRVQRSPFSWLVFTCYLFKANTGDHKKALLKNASLASPSRAFEVARQRGKPTNDSFQSPYRFPELGLDTHGYFESLSERNRTRKAGETTYFMTKSRYFETHNQATHSTG